MAGGTNMQYRFLGRSGLQVSAISLGGWLTYGGHVDEGKSSFVAHIRTPKANTTGADFTSLPQRRHTPA